MQAHFFLPENAVELRAFTHGAMPKTVPQMMQHFCTDWQQRGVDAWNNVPNHWRPESGETVGWWTLPDYLGDHFIAPLLGAPQGTCIMQPNAHWAISALLSCRHLFTKKRKIILTADAFPSVLHTVQNWRDFYDLELCILPLNEAGFIDRTTFLDAIDDETALIFLSHVGFTTGERLPDAYLKEVAQKAHQKGALCVIDGYHAIGSTRIQVEKCDIDVYVGGLLKEGCGSSGNGFLYIREGLDLQPSLGGWFGNDDPFGFHETPSPHPSVRRRFLGGTTAIASLYHAVEGVRVLLDVGLARVQADCLAKTAYCVQHIDRLGLPLVSPREDERRSALMILALPDAHLVCEYLKTKGIFTDSRKGKYLRFAPFVWNTLAELDRFFEVLAETLQTEAYKNMQLSQGVVT